MKIKRIAAMILSVILFADPVMASEKILTERQKAVADKIAENTADNWKKYGVLPSVAVTQAFIESSLGVNQVKPNNLFGIRPGGVRYSSYTSLEGGINAYLDVLNDARYEKALHKKDYRTQLREILAGGYYGEDDGGTVEEYYEDCVNSIEKYGFDEYDKELFRRLHKQSERKRMAKWDKTYTLCYDGTLKEHEIRVDKKIINGGGRYRFGKTRN